MDMHILLEKVSGKLRGSGLLAGVLLGMVSLASAADYSLIYTGLHDGDPVYGINASLEPSPFSNADNYSIVASGDDSGTYENVRSYAYGIFSENVVDIDNSGNISLIATGGTATSLDYARAQARAYGIETKGSVTNSGDISVDANGGSAASGADSSRSLASATAGGIMVSEPSEGLLTNSGNVTVSATGGVASITGDYASAGAGAQALASGITSQSTAGVLSSSGAITVAAVGGSATAGEGSGAYAYAYADAVGLYSAGTVDNSSSVVVAATGGTATAGAAANAEIDAVGMDADGNITNSGSIVLNANGGTATAGDFAEADVDAYGIYSSGDVDNSGGIDVTATGGTATASDEVDAYVEAYGIGSAGAVKNDGAITVAATGGTATAEFFAFASAEVFGIDASGTVDNSGAIDVTAKGGDSSSESGYADHEAEAYGISSESGDVINTGSIAVAAEAGTGISITGEDTYGYAEAYGIDSGGGVINNGTISVTANGGSLSEQGYGWVDASAYGIGADGNIDNSGSMTVSATGGSATSTVDIGYAQAYAYGLDSSGSVTNSGTITVNAQGGTADGALSDEDGDAYADAWGIQADGDIANSGLVTVNATGGTSTADSSEPYALAIGLDSGGNVDNSGDITVTATYGSGTGTDPFSTPFGEAHAGASGIVSDSGDVVNGGNITATAIAPEMYDTAAVGILFAGSGNLTSTGVIRSFGDRAYEVAVMSGTVTLVDDYNLTLDGDPSVGSLYVAGGASLVLNDAMLSVTPVAGATRMNTEYTIFDTSDGGTVSGVFGGLIDPTNPDIVALYHDQATVDSADDTVSLAYRPGASPLLESAALLRHAIVFSSDLIGHRLVTGFLQNRMASAAPRLYAANHMVAGDARRYGSAHADGFFFTPYFANIDKDASPAGYDADLVGFVTGLDRYERGSRYGFHVGFGHAGLDFTGNGYSRNQEDQELLSAGLHLMTSRGNWTVRGQLTGFYGWHDYDGLTGANLELRENADYDSYGVRTTLLAGRPLEGGGQVLLPEAGIEYLWLHRDSFDTDAENSGWDVHSSSLDEHQVSALASLRWLTRLQAGEVEVTPSLSAGVRYLVTDDELDAHQSVAGSGPVSVETDQDDLTGTVSASLRFRKEQLSTELAYGGEFGDDTTLHSAWLRFDYLY